ncbi:hypothetical protein SKAU_G00084550 [Synaphobranchus kaupii]|uniref:Uncharacterized protein n=1 Tax=Synaphobranchus kaupii TaxID=118154 RepID=A0A9Q1FVM7_SYNKA|nr:hypothetical protein SKAU_G00084550 [Synaphobranchus kaupii]
MKTNGRPVGVVTTEGSLSTGGGGLLVTERHSFQSTLPRFKGRLVGERAVPRRKRRYSDMLSEKGGFLYHSWRVRGLDAVYPPGENGAEREDKRMALRVSKTKIGLLCACSASPPLINMRDDGGWMGPFWAPCLTPPLRLPPVTVLNTAVPRVRVVTLSAGPAGPMDVGCTGCRVREGPPKDGLTTAEASPPLGEEQRWGGAQHQAH